MSTTIANVWDWLLRTSWEASILAMLVLLVQWVVRDKLSARWRYALWFVVLMRLVMPVGPKTPYSIFNYARVDNPGGGPNEGLSLSQHKNAIEVPLAAQAGTSGAPSMTKDSLETTQAVLPNRGVRSGPDGVLNSPLVISAQPLAGKLRAKELVPAFWIAGALILGLRILGQNLSFSLRLRTAASLEFPAIRALLNECQARFGIRPSIRLAETHAVRSPALYGLLRPILLLPNGLVQSLSPRELRYVFLHELAHVKRCDMATHWLATVLKVVHWFNPILWFAFHRMAIDRELACDELALSKAEETESKPYGETIIKLLEASSSRQPLTGLVGILEAKDQMVRRLSMIARYRRRPRWSLSAAVLLSGLGLIGLTDAQPQRAAERTPVSANSPEPVLTHTPDSLQRPTAETNKLSYQGKSAEEWLGLLNFSRGLNDKEFVEAINAFRQMGEGALPFLTEKLSAPKTPAENRRTAEARRKAAWALKELGPTAAPAVQDLITALQDEDETVAAYIAMALGDIGPKAESACPALLEGLRFGNGPAAVALAKIDPDNPVLVPTLIEIIKNPGTSRPNRSWQTPGYAAMALQRLGPRAKAAIPALREALGNPMLKGYAAMALLRIAADEPEVVAEANAVVRVKPQPAPDLAKAIEAVEQADTNNFGVETAFQNLGSALQSARHSEVGLSSQLITEKILPLFAKALDNPNPRVRSAACSALNGLGPSGAPLLPKLIAFLQEDVTSNRANVLGALSSIAPGDPGSLPVLIHLLKDWNDGVRQNACAALTHYGPDAMTAVPALHECLKDRVMWVRFNATVALWRIAHEPPSVSLMQDAIREDQDGHFTSMRILEMLGQSEQQTKESLAILRELTKNWEPEVRTNAQALLERYGDKAPAAKPPRASVGRPQSSAIRDLSATPNDTAPIPPSLGPLVKKLRSRDENVRLSAAEELARMGTGAKEALPFVLELLKDGDAETRSYVVSMLADLDPQGAQVLPALAQALADPGSEVRANALVSLKKIGPKAGSSSVLVARATQDPNPVVRMAAREALATIDPQSTQKP